MIYRKIDMRFWPEQMAQQRRHPMPPRLNKPHGATARSRQIERRRRRGMSPFFVKRRRAVVLPTPMQSITISGDQHRWENRRQPPNVGARVEAFCAVGILRRLRTRLLSRFGRTDVAASGKAWHPHVPDVHQTHEHGEREN